MRLLGRSGAAPEPERPGEDPEGLEEPRQDEPAPAEAPEGQRRDQPDYAEVGRRVTAVLNAAEETAREIRAEALAEAATIRENAE